MALAVTTVWEARVPGSDTNGGGYVPGAGTDMSQFDNKNATGGTNCQSTTQNLSKTDAVTNNTTTVTSASANFTSALVNNVVYLSGPGTTTGWYQVTAVGSATSITVDRATGSTGGTGVTINIGGALATPLPAYGASAPYNPGALITIWFKAATWSLAAGWTINITSTGSPTISHIGYNSVRGDSGTQPVITSATSAVDLISANEGSGVIIFRNMKFTHTGATRGIGIRPVNSGANLRVERCSFDGLLWGVNGDNVGSRYPWVNAVIVDTEMKNCITGGVLTNGGNLQVIHSWIHNNTGYGIASNNSVNLTIERSIISSNGSYGVGNAGGNGFVYPTLLDSVFYANGGNGLSFTPQNGGYIGLYARNCVFYGNTGYGLSASAAGLASYVLDHCAYGGNSSGALQNLSSGTGDVTLTADPFTSSSNFSLNSAAGGGALLKAAGYPGVFPGGLSTGLLDVGAVQSAAGSASSGASPVVIRGTGAACSSNSSYTIPFPAGTVAGDLAIIFGHHANAWGPPGSWTANDNSAGAYIAGGVYSKVLTAGDISTGSVTVTTTGAFSGGFVIVTVAGSYPIKVLNSTRASGLGPTLVAIDSPLVPAPAGGDLLLYFGGARSNTTVTVSRGTLQQQTTDTVKSAIALYTETGLTAMPAVTFNYPAGGDASYQAVVNVGPSPVATGGGGSFTFLG